MPQERQPGPASRSTVLTKAAGERPSSPPTSPGTSKPPKPSSTPSKANSTNCKSTHTRRPTNSSDSSTPPPTTASEPHHEPPPRSHAHPHCGRLPDRKLQPPQPGARHPQLPHRPDISRP